MTQGWSLPTLLTRFHKDIQQRLETARETFAHSGTKGDATEEIWRDMLGDYLPKRYDVVKAHVVDSRNSFSEQIDVVIIDRQYSPFIFNWEGQKVVPAESVYAALEAKQTINAELVKYAQKKVASVRRLHRTSLPVPYVEGKYNPKEPGPIIGGLVSFESDWSPPLGGSLLKVLTNGETDGALDLGCVASHGIFNRDDDGQYTVTEQKTATTGFLFELICRLQQIGTVPMIDLRAYAAWLRQ